MGGGLRRTTPFLSPETPPLPPPLPLAANLVDATKVLSITFDQAVDVTGPVGLTNLIARQGSGFAGTQRWLSTLTDGTPTPTFQMGSAVPPSGFPEQVTYGASPAVLVGPTGVAVAPFVIPFTTS